ncbi:carboxypeptidase regulatory-like domain-containing protein [Chloracidobacterium thermophilum]|nr:carboxypeptidase regulatory-like domain-containing protein [Chloracidobacterium thermophilum]
MNSLITCSQRRCLAWLFLGLWLLLHALSPWVGWQAQAQTTTGTILGTVIQRDATPVPGAIVRILNKVNGLTRTARTDARGVYRFDLILPGLYDIRAQADGFRENAIENFIVEVNREKIIQPPPIILEPPTAPAPAPTPSPTVPGQPPAPTPGTTQANIADAALRGSATAEFILALPLRGIRNFDTFALLAPGVAPPPSFFGVNGPGIGPNVGGGSLWSMAFGRAATTSPLTAPTTMTRTWAGGGAVTSPRHPSPLRVSGNFRSPPCWPMPKAGATAAGRSTSSRVPVRTSFTATCTRFSTTSGSMRAMPLIFAPARYGLASRPSPVTSQGLRWVAPSGKTAGTFSRRLSGLASIAPRRHTLPSRRPLSGRRRWPSAAFPACWGAICSICTPCPTIRAARTASIP